MSNTTQSAKTLFDKIYDGCEDLVKAVKKPLAVKRTKRKLESAYDSLEDQKDKAEVSIQELQEALIKGAENASVQSIVDCKFSIKDAEEAQVVIKELYLEMFGVEMK